jgi:putative ABC transport system ATP-binding protein
MFLRALAFLSPVAEGTVLWNGMPVAPHKVPEYRSHVCYVPQRAMLVDGTVRDNLALPYHFKSHSHHCPDEMIWRRWLLQLGREETFLERRSDELSGGEAQIVSLIRVLQLRPEVLLLDEPTSAMDPKSAETVESLITMLCNETGIAYLWITHDDRQARRVGKNRLEFRDGELIEVVE